MARIHGKRGQVLMDETGPAPYTETEVADISAYTLNLTTEKVPVTCFGDTNVVKGDGSPRFRRHDGWLLELRHLAAPLRRDSRRRAGRSEARPGHRSISTYFFSGGAYIDGSLDVLGDRRRDPSPGRGTRLTTGR